MAAIPISLIIGIDVTKYTIMQNSRIIRLVEKAISLLSINDEVAYVVRAGDGSSCTSENFKAIRSSSSKDALLAEISRSNTLLAGGGDSETKGGGGNPAGVMYHVFQMLDRRPPHEMWRPVYIMLFTDGRPDKPNRAPICAAVQELLTKIKDIPKPWDGPLYALQVYVCNHHHPATMFTQSLRVGWDAFSVTRLNHDSALTKASWQIVEYMSKCHKSVDIKDIASMTLRARIARRAGIGSIDWK